MDSIERAIRSAFAKGDPGDRAFREKVYRSAFGALDRAMAANPNVTEAIAARRRQALLAAITAIETEFVPAKAAAPNPAPVPQPPAPAQPEPQVQAPDQPYPISPSAPEVSVTNEARDQKQIVAPTLDGESPLPGSRRAGKPAGKRGEDATPRRAKTRSRRRPGLVGISIGLVVVVGVAAAWWLAGPRTGPAAPPPPTTENTPPRLPGDAATLENWLDIFTPADPTTVAAPGDSRAEVMDDDDGQFMRIRAGASGSPILFDIGRGVLEQVAGGRAVFNIDARGADGQATQISVDCSLADLGDCGRKRYDAGAVREEFLFEIELPTAQPDSGGVIAINPDVEGSGKSLDIFAIRVLPGR